MMNKVILDHNLNAGLKKSTAGGTRQRNLNRHAEGLIFTFGYASQFS
jgi:hypothetical protein